MLAQVESDGRILYRDEASGKVYSEAASSAGTSTLRARGGNRISTLWLSGAQVEELQAVYDELSERVAALDTGPREGAKPYLLELTLVPLEE